MLDSALFNHLHFLRPQWFLLLIPFALISYAQWRSGDMGRQWKPVIAAHLLPRLMVPGDRRRLFSPLWISILVVPLLVVALAGPSWTRENSPFAVDSAALVIAVDLGESMDARDLRPSRLQRARSKIMELAKARGDAYTALLAYAGSGHAVLPLSDDANVLLHYLDALRVGIIPRRGKAPETIIPMARDLLSDGGVTLFIVGDGAMESSIDAFKSLRKEPHIQVIAWGVGKTREELNQDAARGLESAAPPLNESALKALAHSAGGAYQRVSHDGEDVRRILQRINRHFELSDDESRPWKDGGYHLVGPVMLLFLLWFRKGWSLRW